MTNEELAVLAKTDDAALAELWEQNSGMAYIHAVRRYCRLQDDGNTRGVTVDDLKQTAFLGMVQAVGYFDPGKEFKFSTYWDRCVRYEFNRLLGMHTTSKRDALNESSSLDAPLTDEKDANTLGDILPDPVDVFEIYAETDERMSRSEILKKSMEKLSADQQRALQLIFYKKMTKKQAAATMGITQGALDNLEHTAIFALRRSLRGCFDETIRQNALCG